MAEDGDEQGRRDFNKKIVDKIRDDPDFLGHLLENPDETLARSGLAEAVKDLDAQGDDDEVEGHARKYRSYYGTCHWKVYPYRYHLH